MASSATSTITRPPETHYGTVTSWLPLTTTFTAQPGCSTSLWGRLGFLPNGDVGHNIVAFDPAYGISVNTAVSCVPTAATSWWVTEAQGLVVQGTTTRFSIGPIICPNEYKTAWSSVIGVGTTQIACCPSGYSFIAVNPAGLVGECTSPIPSGATMTYAMLANTDGTTLGAPVTTTVTVLSKAVDALGIPINGVNFAAVIQTSTFTTSSLSSTISRTMSSTTTGSTSSITTGQTHTSSTLSGISTSTTSPPTSSEANSTLSVGATVAIGIGTGVAVFAILLLSCFLSGRRNRRAVQTKHSDQVDDWKRKLLSTSGSSTGSRTSSISASTRPLMTRTSHSPSASVFMTRATPSLFGSTTESDTTARSISINTPSSYPLSASTSSHLLPHTSSTTPTTTSTHLPPHIGNSTSPRTISTPITPMSATLSGRMIDLVPTASSIPPSYTSPQTSSILPSTVSVTNLNSSRTSNTTTPSPTTPHTDAFQTPTAELGALLGAYQPRERNDKYPLPPPPSELETARPRALVRDDKYRQAPPDVDEEGESSGLVKGHGRVQEQEQYDEDGRDGFVESEARISGNGYGRMGRRRDDKYLKGMF